MTKTQNLFGISNFGHCDLFGICNLLFGIFTPPNTPGLQYYMNPRHIGGNYNSISIPSLA